MYTSFFCFIILHVFFFCQPLAWGQTHVDYEAIYETLPFQGRDVVRLDVSKDVTIRASSTPFKVFVFQPVDVIRSSRNIKSGWISYPTLHIGQPKGVTKSPKKQTFMVQTYLPKTRVFSGPSTRSTIVNYFPKNERFYIKNSTRFFYQMSLFSGEDRYVLKREVKRVTPSKPIKKSIPYAYLYNRELQTIRQLARARANRYHPLEQTTIDANLSKNINAELLYIDQYFIDLFVYQKGYSLLELL